MNKVHIFLTVSAVMIAAMGCGGGGSSRGSETAAMPETIELEKLDLRDDVYYYNDAPYTGMALWYAPGGAEGTASWEMKDGRFHGEHKRRSSEWGLTGNYKDGKKDGEWTETEPCSEIVQYYKDDMKHGEWSYHLDMCSDKSQRITETWENDALTQRITEIWENDVINQTNILVQSKTEIWENDVLINEWILANALPTDVEDLIITIIKGFQNRDEAALNQLLHNDFGVVFYTMPGAMYNVFFTDKISFIDPPPGYTRMPTDVITADYKIRYEQLPEFDCENGWSKPAGIYCYSSEATETRRIANLMTEYLEISWEAHETKIIEELETKTHYTITVISAEPSERMDMGISLEFTITLIDGKWYLTIVDIRGYCGA